MNEVELSPEDRAWLYDLEFNSQDDWSLVKSHIRDESGFSVLEIPAGSGRNIPLYQSLSQIEVTLADLDQTMCAAMRKRVGAGQIHVEKMDMRSPVFQKLFDLIVLPREGLQMLSGEEDIRKSLRNLYDLLKSGGRLIVDVVNDRSPEKPNYLQAPPAPYFVMDWKRHHYYLGEVARWHFTQTTSALYHIEYAYQLLDRHEVFTRSFQMLRVDSNLLKKASPCQPSNLYGNYRMEPFTEDSPRIVAIFEKEER